MSDGMIALIAVAFVIGGGIALVIHSTSLTAERDQLIDEIQNDWSCKQLYDKMKDRPFSESQTVSLNVIPETWIVKECWK